MTEKETQESILHLPIPQEAVCNIRTKPSTGRLFGCEIGRGVKTVL